MSTLRWDMEPFELDVEEALADEHTACGCATCASASEEMAWEEEARRGRRVGRPMGRRARPMRSPRPPVRRPGGPRPRLAPPGRARWPKPGSRPPKPPRRPVIRRPRWRRPLVVRDAPAPCICPTHGTEFVRWVQSSLNQVLGLRLGVNGVMNRATRDALRDFQKREGLPVDGIAGPETEKVLVAAKGGITDRAAGRSELDMLMDLELENESEVEEFEASLKPQCGCPFKPKKGQFSHANNKGHAWYTPKSGDYGLKLAACVLRKNYQVRGLFRSPTRNEVANAWRTIKYHKCNNHIRGKMFLGRVSKNRCSGRGPYYASIYIPYRVFNDLGEIPSGNFCK